MIKASQLYLKPGDPAERFSAYAWLRPQSHGSRTAT